MFLAGILSKLDKWMPDKTVGHDFSQNKATFYKVSGSEIRINKKKCLNEKHSFATISRVKLVTFMQLFSTIYTFWFQSFSDIFAIDIIFSIENELLLNLLPKKNVISHRFQPITWHLLTFFAKIRYDFSPLFLKNTCLSKFE